MLRATVANLMGHRRRLLGTLVAIVAGVAFLSGALVLGDTMRANFGELFADANADTDAVVRAPEPFSGEPTAGTPSIDESLGDTLREVPGVAAVEATVQGYGRLLGRDGEPIGMSGPPTFAGAWVEDSDLNPWRIVDGRAPEGDDEVVVNRGAAEDGDLQVGDTTILQTPEPIEVEIVGIATFGDEDGLGPTTWTAFALPSAQEHILGGPGQVTSFVIQADDDVSATELTARIDDELPDDLEVLTGDELSDEALSDIRSEFLDSFSTVLVAFAAIGLGVATFSIHNTFSILLAQRTRESALLRALGASRNQVFGAVAAEALAVGVVASAVGAALGVGVSAGLLALFHAFGFPLPGGGMTISATSIVVAVAVGVVVTVARRNLARGSRLAGRPLRGHKGRRRRAHPALPRADPHGWAARRRRRRARACRRRAAGGGRCGRRRRRRGPRSRRGPTARPPRRRTPAAAARCHRLSRSRQRAAQPGSHRRCSNRACRGCRSGRPRHRDDRLAERVDPLLLRAVVRGRPGHGVGRLPGCGQWGLQPEAGDRSRRAARGRPGSRPRHRRDALRRRPQGGQHRRPDRGGHRARPGGGRGFLGRSR